MGDACFSAAPLADRVTQHLDNRPFRNWPVTTKRFRFFSPPRAPHRYLYRGSPPPSSRLATVAAACSTNQLLILSPYPVLVLPPALSNRPPSPSCPVPAVTPSPPPSRSLGHPCFFFGSCLKDPLEGIRMTALWQGIGGEHPLPHAPLELIGDLSGGLSAAGIAADWKATVSWEVRQFRRLDACYSCCCCCCCSHTNWHTQSPWSQDRLQPL